MPRHAQILSQRVVGLAICLLVLCSFAWADTPVSSILADVGIDQHLDAQVPLDLEFRDESGNAVRLGDYVRDQPVILVLAYYRCPMLCTQVLNGVLKSSQAIPFTMGQDYQVVTVSVDARETSEMAAAKKSRYVQAYRREGAANGWHFLVGEQASIDTLSKTVGFRYRYDEASDQFAHASGIMLLTPDGRISRYFYGIDYPPNDLRLGLVESSQGRIGSPVDQILLLCFHYDPKTGKYGLAIANTIRALGAVTVVALGLFLGAMFRQERRRSKLVAAGEIPSDTAPDRAREGG